MQRSIERTLQRSTVRLGALDARLHSLSPLAVLERGYALVLTPAGTLIRSAAQVKSGDKVTTRLADGEFTSAIESTEINNPAAPKQATRKRHKN
jgi:exodeoxyribonuclease VII large subunit